MALSSLTDYALVLAQHDKNDEPFVLVGGHAVNFWADFYLAREPRLAAYHPFLSKDLDLLATTEDGYRLASSTGWEFLPPEPNALAVRGRLRSGSLLVELLHARSRELLPPEQAKLFLPGGSTALSLRLLSPEVLLAGKITLAVDVLQDSLIPEIAARQDVRHVQMLGLVLPHYLNDVLTRFDNDKARCAAAQPTIAILASLRRGNTNRRFEAAYPGVLSWHALLPASIRALPLDDPHRRCIEELDA